MLTDGWTDETNKRFSRQCKRASKLLPILRRVLSLARTGATCINPVKIKTKESENTFLFNVPRFTENHCFLK
jgi:hypothetical protein